ncbi:MAG: Phosphoadenylyl-sulfate reductase [thioredoxin] (EC [uncultured Sulfurovum sp.]|uniref:Phosphoadenylyl-sulfate reductase [thioredoxin] (EC) n=1 Tax=uncultured Sulfurovum sp. TaxID=269237 RepID=A0A6S6T2G9_9BACT|nr:MAG: Phosphoadenylyl-sulfate reductase [thioredoxin] (EC [uncultured Sulfurovum sp.]
MRKELHVISVSGGKDSAALAIYMKEKYPDREFKYLFFDTEEELQDTYDYLNKLQSILGIKVEYKFPEKSFKELLLQHNDYLPSPSQRWCTRKMKLETFLNTMQEFKDYTIYNYVGIRADENREGLIPTDEHIVTVMPFKDDGITLNDVKRILHDAGVGLPAYYDVVYDEEYDIEYFRSRSGCYFCFFMRQIEWVWLWEKHPDEYKKAMEFEKSGYSWIKDMPLSKLIEPESIDKIKKSYKRMQEQRKKQPIKNGTMMEEMDFISEHDKMLDEIEKDELCTMCTL